ncbi:MAG: hypothetical protein IJG33_05140 [Selenomonadaceae bacterium]|nr:hypothetical protein [Selenomonadaceae bacterium]
MDISIIEIIIKVIAIFTSPFFAVFIGRKLENRAQQRKDKMEIFKTLMMARTTVNIYGWTYESVRALNIIDIVFADDKNVRQAWKNLYDKYCISNPSAVELKEREKLMYKLIESIAISLGYKDKITWETIQSPYMPESVKQQLDNQNKCQQLFPSILGGMYTTMSQNGTVSNTIKTSSNENTEQKKELS